MTQTRIAALLGVLVMLTATTAMADSSATSAASLQRVPSDHVCMVNDTRFPAKQIPVDVAGKTYFGCCEMCKGRLATDAAVRNAVDPVSGKPVDKATAVIGALPDGKVLYFESEQHLETYRSRL